MSYALLGNLPPIMGLYAATIAGYVYTLLGSSGQLTIGPVALVGGSTDQSVRAVQTHSR